MPGTVWFEGDELISRQAAERCSETTHEEASILDLHWISPKNDSYAPWNPYHNDDCQASRFTSPWQIRPDELDQHHHAGIADDDLLRRSEVKINRRGMELYKVSTNSLQKSPHLHLHQQSNKYPSHTTNTIIQTSNTFKSFNRQHENFIQHHLCPQRPRRQRHCSPSFPRWAPIASLLFRLPAMLRRRCSWCCGPWLHYPTCIPNQRHRLQRHLRWHWQDWHVLHPPNLGAGYPLQRASVNGSWPFLLRFDRYLGLLYLYRCFSNTSFMYPFRPYQNVSILRSFVN